MEHFHLNRDNYVLPLVWIKYERKIFIWILVELFICKGSKMFQLLKSFIWYSAKTKTCKYYFIYITTSQCLQCCLETLNCYVLWISSNENIHTVVQNKIVVENLGWIMFVLRLELIGLTESVYSILKPAGNRI